jgi:D-sedoheptulose 7-phosphate isomerase
VIRAAGVAHTYGATVIGFTGFDGGALRQMANFNIHVNSDVIEHVEDIHLMLEHLIVKSIKDQVQSVLNVSTPLVQLPAKTFGD